MDDPRDDEDREDRAAGLPTGHEIDRALDSEYERFLDATEPPHPRYVERWLDTL